MIYERHRLPYLPHFLTTIQPDLPVLMTYIILFRWLVSTEPLRPTVWTPLS